MCGVQSFYTPRSNQDGVGVMPHCVTSNTIATMQFVVFDGENWEQAIKADNTVQNMSKCNNEIK